MVADAAVAPVAALLADPARVAMLFALSDGREVSAGELALVAEVTRSTASLHLARLVEGGLVAARAEGRHRHYRLTRPEAVQALAPPAGRREVDPKASRAVQVSPAGRQGLARVFGVEAG